MKIGILSMQKILNYGSFLQAFSLKHQLEKRGGEVYFIDIKQGRTIIENSSDSQKINYASKFDKYFLKRIEHYLMGKKMNAIHTDDHKRYLETDKALPQSEKFDLAVIGSDEVFNATVPSRWGFSTQLFGKIDNAKHVVTYAASCGSTSFEDAQKYGIVDELREATSNLENVSVRDANSKEFVERITGKIPEVNVDPVFLTDYDEFLPVVKRKKPFMIVYAYPNRITNEEEIQAIKSYAKKNGLDIVCVGNHQRWCKHNIPANAFELLGYFKAAQCVVTDTFHGTVFSIKYNKKFVTFVRESNYNKLFGLLDTFCLTERIANKPSELEDVMNKKLDFDVVNERIKSEQERSFEYLDKICALED